MQKITLYEGKIRDMVNKSLKGVKTSRPRELTRQLTNLYEIARELAIADAQRTLREGEYGNVAFQRNYMAAFETYTDSVTNYVVLVKKFGDPLKPLQALETHQEVIGTSPFKAFTKQTPSENIEDLVNALLLVKEEAKDTINARQRFKCNKISSEEPPTCY